MQLKIGGVDRTSLLAPTTLRITDAINQRSTASWVMNERVGVYRPHIGEAVEIYDENNVLVFGGSIDEPEEQQPEGTPALIHAVQAVDHHQLADRRLAIESYDNISAGTIVSDLITKYLAGEGVTAGTIQTGPICGRCVLPYVPVSQALDELSEQTGYQWVIRPNKALDFFARETFAAPWTAQAGAGLIKPRVSRNRKDYRNRQYTRAGHDISDPRIEKFAGDSKTQTFGTSLVVAKLPTVTVNGVAQTVGIRQLESGKQWYWSKGEKEISQDSGGTPLSASDELVVTYQGFFPIIAMVDDGVAQLERKNIEGGTGIYESVDDQPNLDTQAAATDAALGKLRRYAKIATVLNYATYALDLRPGMLQQVNLPEHDLNGAFLISQIETSDVDRTDGKLIRVVTALSGEAVGGWVEFFRRLAKANRTFVIRENEVLIKLKTIADGIKVGDSMSIAKAAPETRVGFAIVGFSEVA